MRSLQTRSSTASSSTPTSNHHLSLTFPPVCSSQRYTVARPRRRPHTAILRPPVAPPPPLQPPTARWSSSIGLVLSSCPESSPNYISGTLSCRACTIPLTHLPIRPVKF